MNKQGGLTAHKGIFSLVKYIFDFWKKEFSSRLFAALPQTIATVAVPQARGSHTNPPQAATNRKHTPPHPRRVVQQKIVNGLRNYYSLNNFFCINNKCQAHFLQNHCQSQQMRVLLISMTRTSATYRVWWSCWFRSSDLMIWSIRPKKIDDLVDTIELFDAQVDSDQPIRWSCWSDQPIRLSG